MRSAAATVALAAATVAACQVADEGGAAPGPAPVGVVEREVSPKIGAPEGYRLHSVEFADARHGYASVVGDDPVSR